MNVVDLFAGAGGLSLGFEQAGYRTMLGVEHDENAAATYRHNISAPCIEADLSENPTLPVAEAQVDVLAGGPPCQGFSIAGKRDSDDERNELVTNFLHYVKELSPETVVMENVTGILSMDDGAVVDHIHDKFAQLGYDSAHQTLSAVSFGVPQERNRVFFIATRDGAPTFPDGNSARPTVGDYLTHDGTEPNMTTPRHQQKTIDRIKGTNKGEPLYDSYTQRIRLDENDVAPTIVCGGPRPQWQLAHPTKDRGLTVRERAALQTFPDWYEFMGGVVTGRVQTGNAVPPKMAKAIAESIK